MHKPGRRGELRCPDDRWGCGGTCFRGQERRACRDLHAACGACGGRGYQCIYLPVEHVFGLGLCHGVPVRERVPNPNGLLRPGMPVLIFSSTDGVTHNRFDTEMCDQPATG